MKPLWQAIKRFLGNPVLVLAAAGGFTLFIYIFFFVQPASLNELINRGARQDLAYLFSRRPWSLVRLGVCFLVLSGLYYFGWQAARKAKGWVAWIIVLVGAFLMVEALTFLFPFDAADLFSYVFHGRIWQIYGGNPYIDVKGNYPNDPFIDYVAWKGTASVYGPLWEIMAGYTAKWSGDSIMTNVITFKTLVALFYAGCVALIGYLSKKLKPDEVLPNVLLFAWNPLILYTTIGNGHNDITVVFCMLAAALAIVYKRHTLAMLALTAGILFKMIPIFVMPAAFFIALRDQATWKKRIQYTAVTLVACVALMVAAYAPFWSGPEILQWAYRSTHFTTSIPAVIYFLLLNTLDEGTAARVVSLSAGIITVMFAFWQALRAWKDTSPLSFIRASFSTLMFFLLVTMTWYHMWYGVWVVGFAILLGGREMFLGLFFSITTIAQQLVGRPLFEWIPPFPPKPLQHLLLAAAAVGPAWVASIWVMVMNKVSRKSEINHEVTKNAKGE